MYSKLGNEIINIAMSQPAICKRNRCGLNFSKKNRENAPVRCILLCKLHLYLFLINNEIINNEYFYVHSATKNT